MWEELLVWEYVALGAKNKSRLVLHVADGDCFGVRRSFVIPGIV